MNVFELFAKLGLDSSEYEEGLKNAGDSADNFKTQFNKGTQQITNGLKDVGVGVGIFAGMGTAAFKAADGVSKNLDEIDKMSQKIGISAEAYQEWGAVLEHCGASVNSLQPVMKTLANQAQSGAEEFQKLGISQQEVATLSQEDLFGRVIEGLQGMEEGTERTAIASKLLGRGATEMGALLNTSADETQAMRDRLHELGGVMSDDAVKQGAKFQDSLTDLKASFKGASNSLLVELLPAFTDFMDKTAQFVADGGLDKIISTMKIATPIVIGLVSAFATIKTITGVITIVQGVTTVIGAVSAASTALSATAIPALIASLGPLMATIGPFIAIGAAIVAAGVLIYKNWDTIKEKAGELGEAISEKWDAIKEKTAEAWENVKNKVSDAIGAAKEIAGNRLSEIKNAFEENGGGIKGTMAATWEILTTQFKTGFDIMDKITGGTLSEIKDKFFSKFNELKDSALGWGRDMISNFINGIKEGIGKVGQVANDVAGAVKSRLHFSEPDVGPLADFHTYAPDMMKLFMQGIEDNKKALEDTVSDAFDFKNLIEAPQMAYNVGRVNQRSGSETGSSLVQNITINLNGIEGKTARELADIIDQRIAQKTNRRNAVWAQ